MTADRTVVPRASMAEGTEYGEYLTAATEAVEIGAKVIEAGVDREIDTWNKTTTDLVTEVDIESESRIIDFLTERYPGHRVFAEESEPVAGSGHRWIIDPLDGTTNFVHGFPHFSVTVAHEIDGEIVAGATYYPPTDDLYQATRGGGATCNGETLSVTDTDDLGSALLLFGVSPPAADDDRYYDLFRRLVRDVQVDGVRRLGSGATDLCYASRGIVDGFFDKYTSPWDIAAGTLYVEEAGGTVTDYSGDPIDFGVGEAEVGLVATNGEIHDALLAAYRSTAGEGE